MKSRYPTALLICLMSISLSAQSLPLIQKAPQAVPTLGDLAGNLGDLNGDGVADFFGRDTSALTLSMKVFSGATGACLRHLDGASDGAPQSIAPQVLPLSDLDGDGVRDYALHFVLDSERKADFISVRSGVSDATMFLIPMVGDNAEILVHSLRVTEGQRGRKSRDLAALVCRPRYSGDQYAEIQIFDGGHGLPIKSIAPPLQSELQHLDPMGDLDGDGMEDLLVGAPELSLAARKGGAAFAISGRHGGVINFWMGEEEDEGLGSHVAALDDMDGDGARDVLILSALSDEGQIDGGELQVFSGAQSGRLLQILPGEGEKLDAPQVEEDLDGDGKRDILVAYRSFSAGYVVTKHHASSDGSVIAQSAAADLYSPAGRSREWGIPDTNGDGAAEIMSLEGRGPTFADSKLRIRATYGAQEYGGGAAGLKLGWESFADKPRYGLVSVRGASPFATIMVAASLAPSHGELRVKDMSHRLYISLEDRVLTEMVSAGADGTWQMFEALDRPELAGEVIYLQAAEQSRRMAVTNGLELLYLR